MEKFYHFSVSSNYSTHNFFVTQFPTTEENTLLSHSAQVEALQIVQPALLPIKQLTYTPKTTISFSASSSSSAENNRVATVFSTNKQWMLCMHRLTTQ